MSSRSRAREQALQVLYLIDISEVSPDRALNLFKINFEDHPEDFSFVRELVEGVDEKRKNLDELIEQYSKNWRVLRMSRIDRNILRMGTYELAKRIDVPYKVVINETVSLAKKFGASDSYKYLNGVLDKLAQQVRAVEFQAG